MNNITYEDFEKLVLSYNAVEMPIIKKAYEYAKHLHEGQFRQSGEPYIIHPLNVAYSLAEMHADKDTVCAGLLHDTLEDTDTSQEEIAREFNSNIAELVDGVTKISKLNFTSKQDAINANTRKIIVSITKDVRIIIIKLADRLHNMRTLEYKNEFKQKENSLETLDIFVPLAYYIGAYRIKSELEDLSLKYLCPDDYKRLENIQKELELKNKNCVMEMLQRINCILSQNNIPYESKVRIKNIYGIYKRLQQGYKIDDIHDLISLKFMVENIANCYMSLGLVHSIYHPINEKFKDYICNPKTNLYQSLHTTVFGPEEKLAQIQIRTNEMDRVASFGLCTYWDINKGEARTVMQRDLKDKFSFFKSLLEINSMFADNAEFVDVIKKELLGNKVYILDTSGNYKELPKGYTVFDYATKVCKLDANNIIYYFVNDRVVSNDYQLKNRDRIKIITKDKRLVL